VEWLPLLVLVLLLLCKETGRSRIAMVAGSPVLPLPVEFVPGGDGSPDLTEQLLELGLGGSGSSGRAELSVVDNCGDRDASFEAECEASPLPMYTADTGLPSFGFRADRGGI
jgi:hypothetical protein